MERERRRFRNPMLLALCTAMLALVVTGCRGCDIAPIPLKIGFGRNIVIGQGVQGLPDGPNIPFNDVRIPIGSEGQCLVTNLDNLVNQIQERVPAFLTRVIGVDKVLVQELRFTASSGDFNFLTNLEVIVFTRTDDGDEREHILRATSSTGLGTSFALTPVSPVDLWALVQSGVNCVSAEIRISGQTPNVPVVFDGDLHVLIFPAFR